MQQEWWGNNEHELVIDNETDVNPLLVLSMPMSTFPILGRGWKWEERQIEEEKWLQRWGRRWPQGAVWSPTSLQIRLAQEIAIWKLKWNTKRLYLWVSVALCAHSVKHSMPLKPGEFMVHCQCNNWWKAQGWKWECAQNTVCGASRNWEIATKLLQFVFLATSHSLCIWMWLIQWDS